MEKNEKLVKLRLAIIQGDVDNLKTLMDEVKEKEYFDELLTAAYMYAANTPAGKNHKEIMKFLAHEVDNTKF